MPRWAAVRPKAGSPRLKAESRLASKRAAATTTVTATVMVTAMDTGIATIGVATAAAIGAGTAVVAVAVVVIAVDVRHVIGARVVMAGVNVGTKPRDQIYVFWPPACSRRVGGPLFIGARSTRTIAP